MRKQSGLCVGLVASWLLLSTFGRGGDWPAWRGPTGQGTSEEKGLPLRWGGKSNENVLWKVPLPGEKEKARQDQNQSSPIVCKDRVLVTVSYWPAGVSDQEFPEHHVVCYRAGDGKMLWDTQVRHGPWSRASDLRGGYTAPTPACDGERVFALFGSSVLAALDLDGQVLWRKEIVPYKNFDVAIGCSSVLFDDSVLLQCDQGGGTSRLSAFDRRTGEVKWERKRPRAGFSHSTPTLVRVQDKPQLLVAGSETLEGVDPADGKVLWSCGAAGDTVSPILGNGLVYIDSGRGGDGGVAVDPTGSGDVTGSHCKWRIRHVPEGFSSPVVIGPYLYRLCGGGVRCWKMANGEEVYAERLPGVSTASSPIATPEGRLYAASAGKSFVIQSGPKFELLATSDLGDPSQASPAVANGRLYLKGRHFLWCIGRDN
jgi:outer membrane protein assembly factor BamB